MRTVRRSGRTCSRRLLVALALAGAAASPLRAQDIDARGAYFRAVADFFQVDEEEVAVLAEWPLPTEEIAVVMFLGRRGGISPDAVAALRRSGRGWAALARQYQVGPGHFHVPVSGSADAGVLAAAYERYRAVPESRWSSVDLSDQEIVALVNVRIIAESLGIPPERVLAAHPSGASFVDTYARLLRSGGAG